MWTQELDSIVVLSKSGYSVILLYVNNLHLAFNPPKLLATVLLCGRLRHQVGSLGAGEGYKGRRAVQEFKGDPQVKREG